MGRRRLGVALAGALGVGVFAAGPAGAAITATRDANALASAIAEDPAVVTGAAFETIPPAGSPAAVSTTLLGEFPVGGRSFAILSSGDATLAEPAQRERRGGHLERR